MGRGWWVGAGVGGCRWVGVGVGGLHLPTPTPTLWLWVGYCGSVGGVMSNH